jgi:hypothetical protein
MSSSRKGDFVPGGNVIARKHFFEEDILNNKRHEQNKEKTYGTLKTCGVN